MKKILCISIMLIIVLILIVWIWCVTRGNTVQIASNFLFNMNCIYSDGKHNSNTDLIIWRGKFYLIHANSPFHLGGVHSKLMLWESDDAHTWDKITEFSSPGEDIRDPKFAQIGDRLFLYVLVNRDLLAEPYQTMFSYTTNGKEWKPFRPIVGEANGWLLWRPKTCNHVDWYVTGYWHGHGISALFHSKDGFAWSRISTIHEGNRVDETDFEFLTDNSILCTARLEYSDSWFGHPEGGTLIATAPYPYTQWTKTYTKVTRLDGPCLFSYGGIVLATGRRETNNQAPFWYTGSIFNRKRTALYWVTPTGLTWLTDFPSAGDTAYGGVAIRGDYLYFTYYSSPIDKDYPWCIGMLTATDIWLVKCARTEFLQFIHSLRLNQP